MRVLTRVDEQDRQHRVIACAAHSPMILERWKQLRHREVQVEEVDHPSAQCCLCPEMAGQR